MIREINGEMFAAYITAVISRSYQSQASDQTSLFSLDRFGIGEFGVIRQNNHQYH